MRQKIFAIFLCITLLFAVNPLDANAQYTDWVNAALNKITSFFSGVSAGANTTTAGASTIDASANVSKLAFDIGEKLGKALSSIGITALKIGALLGVQSATRAVIGGAIITDYNQYLYTSPQQLAMQQMDTFFNTVSSNRLSRANYEGVGPNYDAYLVAQARQSIGGQNFSTNLQNQVSDPSQMFSSGNMKGIMSYMQCANNVMCYTMTATAQYNKEFAKAQEIARNEASNGFLPTKKNGRITRPAELAKSALLQIDQLGTQVIMNADPNDESYTAAIGQIAQGAAISIGARVANYSISSKAEREAIRNKNAEYAFSLSYSTAKGIGINATNGGFGAGTGIGSLNDLNLQIGNTCATAYGSAGVVNGYQLGATVTIQGKKYDCTTKQPVK